MILVTGGAGFIGSHFINSIPDPVVCLDSLTYAADKSRIKRNVDFIEKSILDAKAVRAAFKRGPSHIVHFAAESHVTKSIDEPAEFVETNVAGTLVLLEAALDYWRSLEGESKSAFRFVHISTDEVFGSLGEKDRPFTEDSPYNPSTPYAASKAASDHIVRAFHVTHGLPTITLNCTNNYGPGQHPEKLIPLVVSRALAGEPITIHGDGKQIRDWIHVDDTCRAICRASKFGSIGESYVVGSRNERMVCSVVKGICDILDKVCPKETSYRDQITYVADRAGNDRRYAVNPAKLESLGWSPKKRWALKETVESYCEVYV